MTTVLEEIKADFEAKNPDYKVKLVSYGDYNTLRDTITSAIAGGIAPTAAQTYPDHISLYLEGEALQSLDKYINDPVNGMSKEEQAQFIEGFGQKEQYMIQQEQDMECHLINQQN